MKNKKIIGLLMYTIGVIIYIAFLTVLNIKFGQLAGIYSLISSIGVALFIYGNRLLHSK